MTRYTPPRSMPEFVDLQNGCVSREIFVNDDIYQQEQEQVFARAWLFIGHESQIPQPGDYFVTAMGEESVILTRDSTGSIRAFLNTCRHRGMKVCRDDEGHTAALPAPIIGGVTAQTAAWSGCPTIARRITSNLTALNGG